MGVSVRPVVGATASASNGVAPGHAEVDVADFERPIPKLLPSPGRPSSKKVVKTVEESFACCTHALEKLVDDKVCTSNQIVRNLEGRSLRSSSCFTGCGGAEVGDEMMVAAAAKFFEKHRTTPAVRPFEVTPMWACDVLPQNREEVLALPRHSKPKHLFGDIREREGAAASENHNCPQGGGRGPCARFTQGG